MVGKKHKPPITFQTTLPQHSTQFWIKNVKMIYNHSSFFPSVIEALFYLLS